MNRVFEAHTVSFFDIDANLVCLGMYLVSALIGFVLPSLSWLSWVLPIVLLILEKESKLVKFHAIQLLILQVTVFVLGILLGIITVILGGVAVASGSAGAMLGIAGLVSIAALILAYSFIALELFCGYKAFNWTAFEVPFVGKFAANFAKINE